MGAPVLFFTRYYRTASQLAKAAGFHPREWTFARGLKDVQGRTNIDTVFVLVDDPLSLEQHEAIRHITQNASADIFIQHTNYVRFMKEHAS